MEAINKIWITGANGQLGKALIQKLKSTNVQLLKTGSKEVNITDLEKVLATSEAEKPDFIVNCAAFTAVDRCETEIEKAFAVNAIGPRNLAVAAEARGIPLMHISTDYVFDGEGNKPYNEFDLPSPCSIYGKSKLAGEELVKSLTKRYFIIRTAWLYGEGANFVKTMLRLGEKNEIVKVVKDQIGTPTSTDELAGLMVHLMETKAYGTYHGTCEGSCSWYDFAVRIFERAGMQTKVEPITTSEYPTPVKRPAYSVLDNYMLRLTSDYRMANWETAFDEYCKRH